MKHQPKRHCINTYYKKLPTGDAVIVKEQLEDNDGSITPNMSVIENPKHSYYITKHQNRIHDFKYECEDVDKLDRFVTQNYRMKGQIAKMFNLGARYINNDVLYRSPYIYGADISIEAYVKMKYLSLAEESMAIPTYGFYDVETNIATGEIIMISFLANNQIYTSIRRPWMFVTEGKVRRSVGLDELRPFVMKLLNKHTDMSKYTLHLMYSETEIETVINIFRAIHKEKVDFIGIWNLNFDIPKTIDAVKRSKYSCADIFCAPDLAKKYRYFSYKKDAGQSSHYTLKWHRVDAPAYSQWIDSLGLYSQCRKTQKFLPRYTLDAVLDKHCNTHKMPLISSNHTYMQESHIREYVAYNIFDVIGMDMLEKTNNDILAMHSACKVSPIWAYAWATSVNTNNLYYAWKKQGKILASNSKLDKFLEMEQMFTENIGGTVLNPNNATGVGVRLV